MGRRNIDMVEVRFKLMSLPPSAVATGRLLTRPAHPWSGGESRVVWAFRSQPMFRLYGRLTSIAWDECVFDRLSFRDKPEEAVVQFHYPDLERRTAKLLLGSLPPYAHLKGRALNHRRPGAPPQEASYFCGELSHILPGLRQVIFDSIELEELKI